jgi:hypothetical protein
MLKFRCIYINAGRRRRRLTRTCGIVADCSGASSTRRLSCSVTTRTAIIRQNPPARKIDRAMFRVHQGLQLLAVAGRLPSSGSASSASLRPSAARLRSRPSGLISAARIVTVHAVDGSCRRFISTLPSCGSHPKVIQQQQQQQLQQRQYVSTTSESLPRSDNCNELPSLLPPPTSDSRWQPHATHKYSKRAGIDLATILGLGAVSGVIAAVLAYAFNRGKPPAPPRVKFEPPAQSITKSNYMTFICHESSSKWFALRLWMALEALGVRTFFDRSELSAGGEFEEQIREYLHGVPFGCVILTRSFFFSEWATAEANTMVLRAEAISPCTVVPIFLGSRWKDDVMDRAAPDARHGRDTYAVHLGQLATKLHGLSGWPVTDDDLPERHLLPSLREVLSPLVKDGKLEQPSEQDYQWAVYLALFQTIASTFAIDSQTPAKLQEIRGHLREQFLKYRKLPLPHSSLPVSPPLVEQLKPEVRVLPKSRWRLFLPITNEAPVSFKIKGDVSGYLGVSVGYNQQGDPAGTMHLANISVAPEGVNFTAAVHNQVSALEVWSVKGGDLAVSCDQDCIWNPVTHQLHSLGKQTSRAVHATIGQRPGGASIKSEKGVRLTTREGRTCDIEYLRCQPGKFVEFKTVRGNAFTSFWVDAVGEPEIESCLINGKPASWEWKRD